MNGDFYGLRTEEISNRAIRVEFLADRGPRIVGVYLSGVPENLFAELPDRSLPTAYGDYHLYGGHRLWCAPEASPACSFPDDDGLTIKAAGNGVRLTEPDRAGAVVRKSIEIHIDASRPRVRLEHAVQNVGTETLELAPWAITQLPLGGTILLPQQARKLDKDGLLPNRNLVRWPYTAWNDPRLELGEDWIAVHAQSHPSPFKIGYLNHQGWAAYLRNGILFVKRFDPHAEQPHLDLGCNTEVYAWNAFVELETQAPLSRLGPGEATTHTETWEFHTGLDRAGAVRYAEQATRRQDQGATEMDGGGA